MTWEVIKPEWLIYGWIPPSVPERDNHGVRSAVRNVLPPSSRIATQVVKAIGRTRTGGEVRRAIQLVDRAWVKTDARSEKGQGPGRPRNRDKPYPHTTVGLNR
jgi:hypothetical protein